jgi:hypothetical protein
MSPAKAIRPRPPLRGLATRLGAGDLALRYYHQPISALRRSVLAGGPLEMRRTQRGRAAMIEAAWTLPPLSPRFGAATTEVSFLTGADYWYQTLFCLYSLQLHSTSRIDAVIHDDGSLDDQTVAAIARVAPWARIVRLGEIEARLDDVLPAARFPILRRRRIDYPHIRKLCDIHLGRRGWTVVLDSDMLFFRPPTALLAWMAAPDRPCHLVDPHRAYGYSPGLMAELAGAEEPERVNVGVCGLQSETLDWERLEHWCGALMAREGPSYLQEQALTAMLLAGRDCLRLSEADYRVLPSPAEGRTPSAALHHYVAQSKRSYFQYGWRHAMAAVPASGAT